MTDKKINKRADIPVTILVIGVFAVCVLALLSFLNSTHHFGKFFSGVGLIEEANARIEAENLNYIYLDKTATKLDLKDDGEGFHLFEEKIIFSVEYNP